MVILKYPQRHLTQGASKVTMTATLMPTIKSGSFARKRRGKKKIADFKLKLRGIAESVILRKPNAGAELVAKQLCIDIRSHLDGIS